MNASEDDPVKRMARAIETLGYLAEDMLVDAQIAINQQVDAKKEWAQEYNAEVRARLGHSHEYWHYITEYRDRMESTLGPIRLAITEAWKALEEYESTSTSTEPSTP